MSSTCTYSGTLSDPVKMGQMFIVTGRTTRSARRVDVNLAEDKNHLVIPFHVSCRFQENEVIRNNKANNKFGAEEKAPGKGNLRNPFKAGEEFTVVILVGSDRFHISFNQKDYCDFLFRMPLNRIKVLQVLQDVEYIRRADHVTAYPFPHPPPYMRDTEFTFSNDTPSAMHKGHIIVLHATTFGNAKGSFSIQFVDAKAPRTAIVFTVALPPKNLLTRSSITAKEETKNVETYGPPMPIVSQRPFKIAFGFADKMFLVAINGVQHCSYKCPNPMKFYSGLKCLEHDELLLNILGVDHIRGQDETLRNFEQHSRV